MEPTELFDGEFWQKLQQRHIERAMHEEDLSRIKHRPIAIQAICELIPMIDAEIDSDQRWPENVLIHWSNTARYVSLAVWGVPDGLNEIYPWPDQMLKELWENE